VLSALFAFAFRARFSPPGVYVNEYMAQGVRAFLKARPAKRYVAASGSDVNYDGEGSRQAGILLQPTAPFPAGVSKPLLSA